MARRTIDFHHHPNWHGVTIDGLVANMDKHRIDKTVLLSWEMPEDEVNVVPRFHLSHDPRGLCIPLAWVVEGVEKYPDRFIPAWAPDPRDRHARARLIAAVKLHKIKVYGELKCRMRYDSPDAIAMFRVCGRLKLPVLFHLQGSPFVVEENAKDVFSWTQWYGGDFSAVETMCRLCPDTVFLGHAPGFWNQISGDADQVAKNYVMDPVTPGGRVTAALRKYPNLYCDLSAGSGLRALDRDHDHAREFLEEFSDRCLLGRDYFDDGIMRLLESLGLSETTLDKIFHGNAERLLEGAGQVPEDLAL